ncbi:ECF transporter S component [Fructilactobacillus lindneri]|uniref:ECF transporter S component n=1 Tax=Fructilactobacillus lindneri TaxID=53444 RepID=UPI0009C44591|nr:Riboflavin transporter FmnP [Fructilactobacillus lindneri DSM 20690 = JCM 11027]
MQINNKKTKTMVLVSILAALAYALMFLSFPIIPAFPFLKLDFSDLPILIGLFMVGPLGAVEILLLKLFLYWMTMGFSIPELIGLSSSLIVSLIFILGFYLFRKDVVKHGLIRFLPVIVVAIVLAIVMSILNYFVFLPLYMKAFGFNLGIPLAKIVALGVAPFNLIKGLVDGTIFILIFSRLKKAK